VRWLTSSTRLYQNALAQGGGARKELVSQTAGVESPRMVLDAAQARLMVKMVRDPTALGGLWLEEGELVKDGEEGRNVEAGRDDNSQNDSYGLDDFTLVMTAIVNKASIVRDFGDEG